MLTRGESGLVDVLVRFLKSLTGEPCAGPGVALVRRGGAAGGEPSEPDVAATSLFVGKDETPALESIEAGDRPRKDLPVPSSIELLRPMGLGTADAFIAPETVGVGADAIDHAGMRLA